MPIITVENKDNMMMDETVYDETEAHEFAVRYIDHFFPDHGEILRATFFDFYMILRNAEEGYPHVSGVSFEDGVDGLYGERGFGQNFPRELERLKRENPLYIEYVESSSRKAASLSPALSPYAGMTVGVVVYKGMEAELERRKMPLIPSHCAEEPLSEEAYQGREIERIRDNYIHTSDLQYPLHFLHELFMRFFHALDSAGGLPEISDDYFRYAVAELFEDAQKRSEGKDISERVIESLLGLRKRIQRENPQYVQLIDDVARPHGSYEPSNHNAVMALNIGMLLYRTMETEVDDHGTRGSGIQKVRM